MQRDYLDCRLAGTTRPLGAHKSEDPFRSEVRRSICCVGVQWHHDAYNRSKQKQSTLWPYEHQHDFCLEDSAYELTAPGPAVLVASWPKVHKPAQERLPRDLRSVAVKI